MGLPGSGKTWLALRLQQHLGGAWYNADAIRKMANDWDFSEAGKRRQALRMNNLALFEGSHARTVICDFVCPTGETRDQFNADITIWMNTIEAGRFDDTNKIFEEPTDFDYVIESFQSDEWILDLAKRIKETYHV